MGYDFDLFTVGAGSGGTRASRIAGQYGARVGIAEADRTGGTCVIRGCIPKKYMVYAADFARSFEAAAGFGWEVGERTFDWLTFRDRMHAEIDRLSGLYVKGLAGAGVTQFAAHASLLDPHTVQLSTGEAVTAERILIATGGQPWRPLDLPGQESALTSDDIFHLPELPRRIVIAGGGYIAVEFAGVFAALGVETTLIYRGSPVLNGFDADVRSHVQKALERDGVRVVLNDVFTALERTASGIRCHTRGGEVLNADQVLFAIGRVPKTAGLGLEAAGVETTENGAIKVDGWSRTNVPSVWAVGDVTNRINLTPVAIREGHAFADTEFGGRPSRFDHADVATAVFSSPPIGTVGLTEAQAREQFGDVHIYRTTFRPMKDRLSGKGEEVLMKLVVRASDERILGCHIVGPDAPEMIQAVGIAVLMGATKADFDRTCAVHPTLAEELVLMRTRAI